jgi:glutamyl-tRNA synthetase
MRILSFTGPVVLPKAEIVHGIPMIRLKDLFNVKVTWNQDMPNLEYAGDSLADARAAKAPIVQWLPVQEMMPCTLRTQEGDIRGTCEPAVKNELGNVIQFERVCFARIDAVSDDGVIAYFTHK